MPFLFWILYEIMGGIVNNFVNLNAKDSKNVR